MPLYMDIHELHGATPEDVAKAHAADVEVQRKYGVDYRKYWFNEKQGKVFCLVHAPSAEAADKVHREAQGIVAEKIIEVQPDVAELFLGSAETNPSGAVLIPGGGVDERDPGVRTIFFTDIVESTMLTQTLGDEKAMSLLDVHNRIVRNALADSGGREVKHTGDGIMACFLSAAAAVKCATRIQNDLARQKKDHPDYPLKIRIGAAAGEPVEQDRDLFGSTVQLAARLCSQALPDQILVSNAITELCLGKGVLFEDLGKIPLKGFAHPIHAHAVVWAKQPPQAAK